MGQIIARQTTAGRAQHARPVVGSAVPAEAWPGRRLLAVDGVASLLAWAGVLVVVPAVHASWPLTRGLIVVMPHRVMYAAVAVVVTLVVAAARRGYRDASRLRALWSLEVRGLARCVAGGAVAVVVADRFLPTAVALDELAVAAGTAVVTLAVGRGLFRRWLRQQRAAGRFVQDVVLVGADADAAELDSIIREQPELGYRVRGYVGPAGRTSLHAPRLGGVEAAGRAVTAAGVRDAVLVASALDPRTLNTVTRDLLARGVRVYLSSGLRGIAQHRFRATPLAHEPLFAIEGVTLSRAQRAVKRAVDIVGAAVLLVVFAPVLAVAAIAIRLDTKGPVVFRQQRAGRGDQLFTMYKLRTMVVDAEARQGELAEHNQRDGPLFKMADDPRVTRVGRWLRATSLDELPQLWNVLCGTMSLVGPRPLPYWEAAAFDDRMRLRAQVAPGLTGLWQVEARDNPAYGPFRRLDLFYVENWSPWLDAKIIAATVVGVAARVLRFGTSRGASDRRTIVLD